MWPLVLECRPQLISELLGGATCNRPLFAERTEDDVPFPVVRGGGHIDDHVGEPGPTHGHRPAQHILCRHLLGLWRRGHQPGAYLLFGELEVPRSLLHQGVYPARSSLTTPR